MENLIKKWEPILHASNINKIHWDKIANYIEFLQQLEIKHSEVSGLNFIYRTSMIPYNLKIAAKIKDLSKITFIKKPSVKLDDIGRIKTEVIKFNTDSNQDVTLDNLSEDEDRLLTIAADDINYRILNNEIVYVFLLCESASIIGEKGFDSSMYIKCRYTSANV